MNVRERLKEAYESVEFDADGTWSDAPDAYRKGNMELYLSEQHIQGKKLQAYRPRTVRECIPNSRLAQYSNYPYNESREMSYAASTSRSDVSLYNDAPTEPWEMPEVDELFRWFLYNHPEEKFPGRETHYHSPLLKVSGFEDKILKIRITEDRVKNIWKKSIHPSAEGAPRTNVMLLNVFSSPLRNFLLLKRDDGCNQEWLKNLTILKDFEQLEHLTKSFQKQDGTIAKYVSGGKEGPTSMESTSTEILYSEVLQGVSPSRKIFSSCKTERDEASSSQDSFTNYPSFDRTRGEVFKIDNYPELKVPRSSNKFVQPKTPTGTPYFQTHHRWKQSAGHFQGASASHDSRSSGQLFAPSYLQQTYVYPQTYQHWIPSNFTGCCYPTAHLYTSSWYATGAASTDDGSHRRRSFFVEVKEDPPEVEAYAEEQHQISASVSEELEMQALEQYSNSNENFYQELERQAAEQYASSPE